MPTEPPTTVPIGYLLLAIAALCSAVGILFWQLMAAKNESLALAREVFPIAALLNKTTESLLKVIERNEQRGS